MRALLVAGLVVLAGCGAQPDSGGRSPRSDGSAASSPTLSPDPAGSSAPVATAAPSVAKPVTAAPSADPAAPAVSYVRTDLTIGTRTGVSLEGAALVLDRSGLPEGTYADPYGPRATISYEYGAWTSAWSAAPFAIDELIASWTALTPPGTWVEIESQLRGSGRETKWYRLAIWASGDSDIHRTTVRSQDDGDAGVSVDTVVRAKSAPPLDGHRLRATLYRRQGSAASPRVTAASAMVSRAARYTIPSPWSGQAVELPVPTLSQETHTGHYPEYDGGGEAWCSPTSLAMVLRFFGTGPGPADLAQFPGAGHVDGNVDHAARFTYDWSYSGAGNWPFNTAHAAAYGLDGFVTRLRSLVEAQRFIEAGVPLIASVKGELSGFLFGKTNGHLLVIRGFAANGDVVTNDPAVLLNAGARKVYPRAGFEKVWLEGSGGVVYVIRPPGMPLPANGTGLPANW